MQPSPFSGAHDHDRWTHARFVAHWTAGAVTQKTLP